MAAKSVEALLLLLLLPITARGCRGRVEAAMSTAAADALRPRALLPIPAAPASMERRRERRVKGL